MARLRRTMRSGLVKPRLPTLPICQRTRAVEVSKRRGRIRKSVASKLWSWAWMALVPSETSDTEAREHQKPRMIAQGGPGQVDPRAFRRGGQETLATLCVDRQREVSDRRIRVAFQREQASELVCDPRTAGLGEQLGARPFDPRRGCGPPAPAPHVDGHIVQRQPITRVVRERFE